MTGRVRNVPIDRDVVPIYSVDASLMLDNTTGYIKINRFSATTFDEFMKALKMLQGKGMQSLVLDLRDNPGGYLTAATQIADQFINEDKLLVYTEGRRTPRTDYKASEPGLFEKGNLAVLVDENSASASEILAGAVQDWDRGLIIGRRTFGKGLVQEQYDLDDGSALRLTVAKYYTPSGRSIQRSFAEGKEAYASDFQKRFSSGELTGKDSVTISDTTRYYTANHRVVYGGGGIKPDVYVPYDTARLSSGVLTMLFSDDLKSVLWDYYTNHAQELRRYKTVNDFNQGFTSAGQILNSYVNAKKGSEHAIADRILKVPANRDYFLNIVKAQVARVLFRNNGYYAITSRQDSMVQKAVALMRERKYSELIGR
jgi:carboxyl-terminal processing protease